MILDKIKFYKKIIFISLMVSIFHIISGVSCLLYFYTNSANIDLLDSNIEQSKLIFNILDQKHLTLNDISLLTKFGLIENETKIYDIPNIDELTKKALIIQAGILTKTQIEIKKYKQEKNIALKILLFSIIITVVFGWIIPTYIIKKTSNMLIEFKNDLQKNIEKAIYLWKEKNIKDNQAAYLLLSVQALCLYVSIRGDSATTQILFEIAKNLDRVFNPKDQAGI